MFKIEKGIPLPARKYIGGQGKKRKYPFPFMKPGDSFLYPAENQAEKQLAVTLILNASNTSGKVVKEMKFTTRHVEDGVRCWRVK